MRKGLKVAIVSVLVIGVLWASGIAPRAYAFIQSAGVAVAQRATLNFVAGLTCVDNAGANRTDCTSSGVSTICTTVSLTGQALSLGPTNLLCGGVQATAGVYRITYDSFPTSGNTGSGTVNSGFAWHSGGTAKSVLQSSMGGGCCGITALTPAATDAAETSLQSILIFHDGTTNITYSTTYAATGQYDLYIVLERLL